MMISPIEFTQKLRAYFGENMEPPLAFWRSNKPIAETEKTGGCFFKGLQEARQGQPLTLTADNVGCGGGKFYLGFTEMPEYVPKFVSLKERYKRTPDDVESFIVNKNVQRTSYKCLNFIRIDKMKTLNGIEGLLFFAEPDVLSGLCGWAFYDNNDDDAVVTRFGSGCSAMITSVFNENMCGGSSCFLGLFDPSVRVHVGANELGFSIPSSRLGTMLETIDSCFLNDSPAWNRVKDRINGEK